MFKNIIVVILKKKKYLKIYENINYFISHYSTITGAPLIVPYRGRIYKYSMILIKFLNKY
jgi:hypothetical protein